MEASLSGLRSYVKEKWFSWRMRSRFQSSHTFTFHTLLKKNKKQKPVTRKLSGTFLKSLLHHRVLASPSRSVQAECANVIRNAEPFEKQLDKNNSTDKDDLFLLLFCAVPETSSVSHHPSAVRSSTVCFNCRIELKSISFMCHKNRISKRLQNVTEKKKKKIHKLSPSPKGNNKDT